MQTCSEQVSLPWVDVGSAKRAAMRVARSHLSACVASRPDTLQGFLYLLAMASDGGVAAQVQLVRMGVEGLDLDSVWKLSLFAVAFMEHSVDMARLFAAELRRREISNEEILARMDVIRTRAGDLWCDHLASREKLTSHAERLGGVLRCQLPRGLKPAPHQLEALVMMHARSFRALLADDMGLGKTVMALCSLLMVGAQRSFPLLIASPSSMVGKWVEEAEKWIPILRPRAVIVDRSFDPQREMALAAEQGRNLLLSASWGQVPLRQQEIAEVEIKSLVADEAHFLKNIKTQRTRAVMRLRGTARQRLLLTGTPSPNGRPIEYYPLLRVLRDDLVGPFRDYKFDFCGPESIFARGGRRVWTFSGRSNEAQLAVILERVRIRREKAEIGDLGLPDKTRYVLPVDFGPEDLMQLARIEDEVRSRLEQRALELEKELRDKGLSEDVIERRVEGVLGSIALTLAGQLRVAVGLIKARWSRDLLKDLLEEGHRVVVFTKHKDVCAEVVKVCLELVDSKDVLWGTGGTPRKERDSLVERWEAGQGKFAVFTGAFAAGVTLVSGCRGVMIERFWVPEREQQAEDRLHRIGQKRKVAWFYPMARGTVDDITEAVVTWKEDSCAKLEGSLQTRLMKYLKLKR